jgi:lysophospholipase L1-like esterase
VLVRVLVGVVVLVVAIACGLLLRRGVFWILRQNALYAATIREFGRRTIPAGAIVFTGSSTIRFWDSLARDFAPFPVVNFGFGGAVVSQVVHFAKDIVPDASKVSLRAIVFYCGGNDLSWGVSVDDVVKGVERFLAIARERQPDARIYVLSVCRTPSRWLAWRRVDATNERLQRLVRQSGAHWIDVTTPMSNERGRPRRGLYRFDGIHPNEKGYALWTSVMRPRFEAELPLSSG